MSELAPRLAALYARGHRGIRFGLGRVGDVLSTLGIDPDATPAIVVAGTNGKGSVSAMVESIARRAGRRTGLYTSPHLERIHERIRIDGEPVDDDTLAAALDVVLSPAAGARAAELSFFETLTVAAFVAFARVPLDLVVLEVGLGGRLDATNVVRRPRATAVVTITEGQGGRFLEHADWLGADIATIAREKAGIAKTDVPLVLGPLGAEAASAVVEEATSRGAGPIWAVDPSIDAGNVRPILVTPDDALLPDGARYALRPGLPGAHQVQNAAVAAALAHLAFATDADIRGAISPGIAGATWPGRLERLVVPGDVTVVLDCAHNLEGARALAAHLASREDAGRTVLLFGALADKPFAPMLDILAPLARDKVFVPLSVDARSSASPTELAARFGGDAERDTPGGFARALAACRPGDTLVVTGSVYLVGDVRARIRGGGVDRAIGL